MKKLLLLISLAFVTNLVFAQTFTKDGINYIITSASTVAIGSNPTFVGDAIIPESFTNNGVTYSVTDMASGAFENCSGLTSITLPEGLYNIQYGAFANCTALKTVTIPASVFQIRDYAFSNCTGLKTITLKRATPTAISELVFYNVNTAGVSLKVPLGTVSEYQDSRYNWNTFNINTQTFKYQGINYKVISSYSAEVGRNTSVFGGGITSASGNVVISNEVEYEGTKLAVTQISGYAFYNCSGIKSITIPNSVINFGINSLYGLTGLTSMNVDWADPSLVSTFMSFGGFTQSNVSLSVPFGTAEKYDANASWTDFNIILKQTALIEGINYFFTSDTTMIVSSNPNATGIVNIPNKINYKGKEYSVTGIQANAFAGSSITGVNFTFETITYARMASVETSYLDYIGEKAFFNCVGLKTIDIPSTVTEIADSAFANCTGLEEVIVNWETPLDINENVFDGVQISGVALTVPFDTEQDYKSAPVWKNFAIVTSLDNFISTNKSIIYPNPVANYLNIEIENANVVLFDSKGEILKTFTLLENVNSIDLSDLPSGIYMIKITSSKESFSEKLVIE